jgi:adenine specific DNA methylase Mod
MVNKLFYGDNLTVLRESIPDESVDLIYLDPPFNSNASYNVLFKAPSGEQSAAQIEAFDDTWVTRAADIQSLGPSCGKQAVASQPPVIVLPTPPVTSS